MYFLVVLFIRIFNDIAYTTEIYTCIYMYINILQKGIKHSADKWLPKILKEVEA